jgi:hypothetical protein
MARMVLALSLLALTSCVSGGGDCTEIGCESETKVAYNGFSVTGPYDLTLGLGEQVTVRCNDDDSMEALGNPEYVTCDNGGFEILGEEGNRTSITVTIVDIDLNEAVVANALVQLSVEPNGVIEPNGPDCEPVCYVRFGAVVP